MKTIIIKKLLLSILILSGICATITLKAQYYYSTCTCVTGNPPGYCYLDKNGNTKCHKFHSNNGNDHDGDACICAIAHKGTGSEEISDGIYPNPLINSTAIHVTLPETQKISLKIFDLAGRLIATLADGFFETGEHKLEWTATNANGGIYILRLQTPAGVQTKKLVVVK
jgi:hypothetical protein